MCDGLELESRYDLSALSRIFHHLKPDLISSRNKPSSIWKNTLTLYQAPTCCKNKQRKDTRDGCYRLIRFFAFVVFRGLDTMASLYHLSSLSTCAVMQNDVCGAVYIYGVLRLLILFWCNWTFSIAWNMQINTHEKRPRQTRRCNGVCDDHTGTGQRRTYHAGGYNRSHWSQPSAIDRSWQNVENRRNDKEDETAGSKRTACLLESELRASNVSRNTFAWGSNQAWYLNTFDVYLPDLDSYFTTLLVYNFMSWTAKRRAS